MICVLYNNTQKNARKNTKKDRKNPKKYIISMNNAFNNLCEVSNSRVTIITAIILIILQKIVTWNIPVIGEYIADIVDIVQNSK